MCMNETSISYDHGKVEAAEPFFFELCFMELEAVIKASGEVGKDVISKARAYAIELGDGAFGE